MSFKYDKHISNFLVRSTLKSHNQPGTFKWKDLTLDLNNPSTSMIDLHIIYLHLCHQLHSQCKKIWREKQGENLQTASINMHLMLKKMTEASKSVKCHFSLLNHSIYNMTICGLACPTQRKHRKL